MRDLEAAEARAVLTGNFSPPMFDMLDEEDLLNMSSQEPIGDWGEHVVTVSRDTIMEACRPGGNRPPRNDNGNQPFWY